MPKKAHTEEQIVAVPRQVEAGARVDDVCRKVGISQATYYLWKRKYTAVGVSELRELAVARRGRAAEAAGGGPEPGSSDAAGDCLKKAVRPRARRKLARWAQEAYRISERHAARLVKLAIGTLRYQSRKVFDEMLRHHLRELAGMHVRYGYRRLTVLLRREGWYVNAKRIYRLYRDEGLIVRTKERRKMARRQRTTRPALAARPNQCWSMDFVSDKLAGGRSFRILTVVDQFTRECVALEADRSMTGMKVAQVLEHAEPERGALPESIRVDNGSEFCSRALEAWAMSNEVQLCFIRPSHPVENGFIESFNGRLRDECLNVEWFTSLDDAQQKLAKFREHYNRQRPHRALVDRTPAAFAELHQGKASTLLGRALQSLLMEPLECAKPASTAGEGTYTAPNL
jgi:putative transposase